MVPLNDFFAQKRIYRLMLTSIPDLLKIITPNQRRIDAAQAKQELEQNITNSSHDSSTIGLISFFKNSFR